MVRSSAHSLFEKKLILTKITLTASSVVRALQHIQAINASDEFAKRVGIAPGTAMLLMTRVGYTADNMPIEITDTYCRNDYYGFVAELRRYDFAAELRP